MTRQHSAADAVDVTCPSCDAHTVEYYGRDGYECRACGHTWGEASAGDTVFDRVVETDTVELDNTVECTVVYVAPDRDELEVRTTHGVRYRLTHHPNGAQITQRKTGPTHHTQDYTRFDDGDVVSLQAVSTPAM